MSFLTFCKKSFVLHDFPKKSLLTKLMDLSANKDMWGMMCQSACCGVIDENKSKAFCSLRSEPAVMPHMITPTPVGKSPNKAIAFICLVLTGTLGVGLPEFFLKSILHSIQGLWRLEFLDLYISIELSRTPKVVKETHVGAFWDKADENQWQSYACIHWTVDSSLSISSNVVFISYFITDLFGGRSSPNSTQKKCQGFWSFPMVPRLTFQSSIKVPSTHCKCLCNISHVYSIHALAVCKYIAHVWSHKLMRSTNKVLYMYIYL